MDGSKGHSSPLPKQKAENLGGRNPRGGKPFIKTSLGAGGGGGEGSSLPNEKVIFSRMEGEYCIQFLQYEPQELSSKFNFDFDEFLCATVSTFLEDVEPLNELDAVEGFNGV